MTDEQREVFKVIQGIEARYGVEAAMPVTEPLLVAYEALAKLAMDAKVGA